MLVNKLDIIVKYAQNFNRNYSEYFSSASSFIAHNKLTKLFYAYSYLPKVQGRRHAGITANK